MSADSVVALVLAVGILIYLGYSLLRPERF